MNQIPAMHELKTHVAQFNEVVAGRKTGEIRLNDRDFKLGDNVCLREYDPITEREGSRYVLVKITHILPLADWVPSANDFVLLSFHIYEIN